jgi:hypothetical protein
LSSIGHAHNSDLLDGRSAGRSPDALQEGLEWVDMMLLLHKY